jgi:hypothetical protein
MIRYSNEQLCRCQWACSLRRGFATCQLLELCVRIPPGAWMSVSYVCWVPSCRGLCVGLITRPEKSYRVWCVWVWSWSLDREEALAPLGVLEPWKKKDNFKHLIRRYQRVLRPCSRRENLRNTRRWNMRWKCRNTSRIRNRWKGRKERWPNEEILMNVWWVATPSLKNTALEDSGSDRPTSKIA